MRKICIVLTARPNYSRIKMALLAMREHPGLQLELIIAASANLKRFGGSVVSFIEKDGFKVAERIFMQVEGENLITSVKTTGLGLIELATAFDRIRPDAVMMVGDRYEAISVAIAASYMNIPLIHLQGGEVTGNIDEKVRHSITKLADIHLACTPRAREWIIRMGEDPERVFYTGCPSIDLAAEILKSPVLDFDPIQKYGGVGHLEHTPSEYVVVMQHPTTTSFGHAREQIEETLKAVEALKVPAFWFWPNPDAGSDDLTGGIRAFREKYQLKNIRFFINMGPTDFLRLIYNSKCLIGNSSVGIRETSFLGVPVVNIGDRQAYRDRGPNVIDVAEYREEPIRKAIEKHLSSPRPKPSHIYGDGKAGQKIADVVAKVPLTFHKHLSYAKENVSKNHLIEAQVEAAIS